MRAWACRNVAHLACRYSAIAASAASPARAEVHLRKAYLDRPVPEVRRVIRWIVAVSIAAVIVGAALHELTRPESRPWDRVRYEREYRPEVEAPNYERDSGEREPITYRL